MVKTPSKKAPANGAEKAANGKSRRKNRGETSAARKKRSDKRVESCAARKIEYFTHDFISSRFFGLPVGFKIPLIYSGNYPGGYTKKGIFRHGNKTWKCYGGKKKVIDCLSFSNLKFETHHANIDCVFATFSVLNFFTSDKFGIVVCSITLSCCISKIFRSTIQDVAR